MTEVLVEKEEMQEVDRMVDRVLEDMTVDEKKELLAFINGARFAKRIEEREEAVRTA